MAKLPAFQFYPADWRKDLGVQSLGFYERGVWFEILCLMHESEQRGQLVLNGKPMPDEMIARLLGLDKQGFLKALTLILEAGVASRSQDGTLINRRMVRDEKLRTIRTEAGKKGGNPVLLNQKSNPQVKQTGEDEDVDEKEDEDEISEEDEIARTRESEAVQLYHKFFPSQGLSPFQQEIIDDRVADLRIWRDALTYWKGNNHFAKNIANICNYYDDLKDKRNGTNSKIPEPGETQTLIDKFAPGTRVI